MGDSESSNVGQLGRIALKRVAVPRKRSAEESSGTFAAPRENPANRLVPYLDLFARLDDAELGRLATVDPSLVTEMRTQVDQIQAGLSAYVDLVDRLSEAELVRLTQASQRTVRFWLLCQPRDRVRATPPPPSSPDAAASHGETAVPASASSSTSQPIDAEQSASGLEKADPDEEFDFELFDDDDDDLF